MPSRIRTPVYGKVGRCSTMWATPHPQSCLFKYSLPKVTSIFSHRNYSFTVGTGLITVSFFSLELNLYSYPVRSWINAFTYLWVYSIPTVLRTDWMRSLSGINLIPTDSDIVPVFCKELVLGVSLDDRTFSYPNISCKNVHTVLNLLNLIVYYVIDSIFCRGVIVISLAEVLFCYRMGKWRNRGF